MADWIDRYRASVSWGDQIHADLLWPSNTVCCWVPATIEGQRHYRIPGCLANIPAAIATAQQALQAPGCRSATVLFLDEEATPYQVEEACNLTAAAGIGCGFLEPQPEVLHLGLLTRASEGTLLEGMVQKLEESP
jgi:hypothetical protein